ncbi:MAG TPA: ester cyclase [Anaerolineae bacterium]|nr:ester cyclase [Anaerolineae bacterium]
MSNKSVSAAFFEKYGKQHDVEGCGPLFAEDAVIHFNGSQLLNFEGYKQVGHAYLAGIPDMDVTILDQMEEDGKVVSRVRWSGTQTGELFGIPPTRRSFHNEDITIDHVVNGQIRERWTIGDLLGMMQQLGAIPS